MTNDQQLTAIIIDDEELMRRVIRVALSGIDCNVLAEADDGVSGLALAQELNPDLILLDIKMPNMDGMETLKKLRAWKPDVYVVMLTALDADGTIEDCMIEGARDFLKKNMPVQDMVKRLERHAERLLESDA